MPLIDGVFIDCSRLAQGRRAHLERVYVALVAPQAGSVPF